MERGKSTDSLMRHIRDTHKIAVQGTKDKRALLEMGYFHGYKAFRIDKEVQPIAVKSFKEIEAIYKLDSQLKALLYPVMMQVETSLKNRTIAVVTRNRSPLIDDVFNDSLDRYREEQPGSSKYRERIAERLRLKRQIDGIIADRYASTPMIQYFVHKGEPVPIWAIFELFTMGDFGAFLGALNRQRREELSQNVGILDRSRDTNFDFMVLHVFVLKSLRNAIAHNSIVFDCRFRGTQGVRRQVKTQLSEYFKMSEITFDTMTDYFALLGYYLLCLKVSRRQITKLFTSYRAVVHEFHQNIGSQQLFDQIFTTEFDPKVDAIFVKIQAQKY